MASVSTVHKYGIYYTTGEVETFVELPAYPTSVIVSDNYVSKSWNDLNAVFKDKLINIKAKVVWQFEFIEDGELTSLYQTIRSKIVSSKSRFFYINAYTPALGWTKFLAYLGAEVTFKSTSSFTNCGQVPLWSGEIHWIEVDGVILNTPSV